MRSSDAFILFTAALWFAVGLGVGRVLWGGDSTEEPSREADND
jgi:hypothetical protein